MGVASLLTGSKRSLGRVAKLRNKCLTSKDLKRGESSLVSGLPCLVGGTKKMAFLSASASPFTRWHLGGKKKISFWMREALVPLQGN